MGDTMEIKSVNEFKKHIDSNKFKSPIIIYGDEKYLIEECTYYIMSKIKDFPELNISTLETDNITMDNIVNACETTPFMSDYKIVHIKSPDFIKKTGRNAANENEAPEKANESGISMELAEYLKDIGEGIIILITFDGEIDLKSKLTALSKNSGTIVGLNELRGAELQKHVEEMFEKKGKSISRSDLVYFISEVGNSLLQIENEVEKLCSLNIESAIITRDDIDRIVSKTAESNIFKMVDNISKKDAPKAVSILNTLLFQREEPAKILGMIIRQYRLLLNIKLNMEAKTPVEKLKSSLKLRDFAFQNLMKLCGLYTDASLKKALECCLCTDSDIKNSRVNPDLALELLIINLCK